VTNLSDLDPPRDTRPGYRPDPLGGPYQRWWDGRRWVNQVGPPPGEEPSSPPSAVEVLPWIASLTAMGIASKVVDSNVPVTLAVLFSVGLLAWGIAVLAVRLAPSIRRRLG